MYLLDASAIVDIVLRFSNPEKYMLNRYTIDLAKYEAINAVWKLVRRGILTREEGKVFALKITNILKGMRVISIDVDMLNDILEVALQTGLTVYDSSYLYVAKYFNLKLVTEDKKLRDACLLMGVDGLTVDMFVNEV